MAVGALREPDENSTDDELYEWFVRSIGMGAREVRDGVIEVPEAGDPTQPVTILLTREQLRIEAWSPEDISDDSHDGEQGVWPAPNPVLAGLRNLSISADEALATLHDEEACIVLRDHQFWGWNAGS